MSVCLPSKRSKDQKGPKARTLGQVPAQPSRQGSARKPASSPQQHSPWPRIHVGGVNGAAYPSAPHSEKKDRAVCFATMTMVTKRGP